MKTMSAGDLARLLLDDYSIGDWKVTLNGKTLIDPEDDESSVDDVLADLDELARVTASARDHLLKVKTWMETMPKAK